MFEGKLLALFWFLIGLVFALAELAMPGFVVIFFGIGAWLVTVLVLVGVLPSFNGQMLVFLLTSIAALILFRKQGKKIFEGKVTARNQSVDDVVGEKAVVAVDIRPPQLDGKIELHGTLWTASADQIISKETIVEIVARNNLTCHVRPVAN